MGSRQDGIDVDGTHADNVLHHFGVRLMAGTGITSVDG